MVLNLKIFSKHMSSPPGSPLPQNVVLSVPLIIQPLDSSVHLTLDQTITNDNYVVTNQQGQQADGTEITQSTFLTTNTNAPNITEQLTETVVQYYDDDESNVLLNQIKEYALEFKCSDFHGKGTIDDYKELFVAAAKIANESKQMQLNVDVEGFAEFGQAADDLSALFNSFIIKLQKVNIIDDTSFLRVVSIALGKIVNLSNIFGKFKETILATSTINIPKSIHNTSILLNDVMDEVNCALGYINYFVNPVGTLNDSELSAADKNVIDTAVSTIDSWNVLCDQGVSIAMSNNADIQNISQVNSQLKIKTDAIKISTNLLKAKFATYNIQC
jgi:hypothetical protein